MALAYFGLKKKQNLDLSTKKSPKLHSKFIILRFLSQEKNPQLIHRPIQKPSWGFKV